MKMKIRKETIKHYSGYKTQTGYHINKLHGLYTYEYDSDGRILRVSIEYYDDEGNISDGLKVTRRKENERYIYERFDLDGKPKGWDKYDDNNRLVESFYESYAAWMYDENGNVSKEIYEEGGYIKEIHYEYDTNGRRTKTIIISNSGTFVKHHYYSKDFLGNIVESIFGEDGEFMESNIIDPVSNKVIQNKEHQKCDGGTIILRYYTHEGKHLSYCSWKDSDNLLQSKHTVYLDYDAGHWTICVSPSFCYIPESEEGFNKNNECFIDIREIEYSDEHLIGELLF